MAHLVPAELGKSRDETDREGLDSGSDIPTGTGARGGGTPESRSQKFNRRDQTHRLDMTVSAQSNRDAWNKIGASSARGSLTADSHFRGQPSLAWWQVGPNQVMEFGGQASD